MENPDNQGQAGRRPDGTFMPGVSGNPAGRPKGIDFRKLVQEFRKSALDGDLQEVYQSMLDRAKDGDVQAAKLILDKLCDNDAIKIEHSGEIIPKMTPQEVAKEILRIEQALADDRKP